MALRGGDSTAADVVDAGESEGVGEPDEISHELSIYLQSAINHKITKPSILKEILRKR